MIKVCLIAVFFFMGCKKDDNVADERIVAGVSLHFFCNSDTLRFDTIRYVNSAGNPYGVENLQFYLSAFEFEKENGDTFGFSDVVCVNAKNNTGCKFEFKDLPSGNYKSMKFLIGLDSAHNIENGLPNTVENNNMTWPVIMGGGFHFLKLEGSFLDSSLPYGYAMHLGRNENCVEINLVQDFYVNSKFRNMNLVMNINEWFQNPYVYDFNMDGNYSMGDSAAMSKLSHNGVDVFTIYQ